MTWSIREARSDDYGTLCALWSEVGILHARAVPEIFREAAVPERSRAELAALLDDPDATVLVAEADGRVVGYAQVTVQNAPLWVIFTPRRFGKVNDLGVTAAYRRRGIGRALMLAAEDWVVERGATTIELNVWAFNAGARALYASLGYQTQSTRMSKPLHQKGDA